MAGLKILVVGDPGSIHAARFVSLLQEQNHRVEMFQPELWYAQDEHLKGVTLHVALPYEAAKSGNRIVGAHKIFDSIFSFLVGRFPSLVAFARVLVQQMRPRFTWRAKHLVSLIRRLKPDVIFSLKMQNEGYVMGEAAQNLSPAELAHWVHFSWGTDFELFGKNFELKSEHLPRIRETLSRCPYLISDCERDQRQAKAFGFRGELLGASLAPGGFDLESIELLRKPLRDRKIILVKGRQGFWVGQAFKVLAALRRIDTALLSQFEIKVAMPSPDMRAACEYLKNAEAFKIELLPKLPYAELLALYGSSRIAISASDIDGTPSFLIESMALGALPIHTDMDSVREWITHDQNGLLFDNDDVRQLARDIERALKDDALVEQASQTNFKIARERMNRAEIGAWITRTLGQKVLRRG